MDSKTRYEKLFERVSSPKSVDCGRGTIYLFPKYCKTCGTGMKQIQRHDRRALKMLFKKGFCSDECRKVGPRDETTFPLAAKSDHSLSKTQTHLTEEMAFTALEVRREELEKGIAYQVRYADETFNFLSEKLAYLESVTGQAWSKTKYYFWLKEE